MTKAQKIIYWISTVWLALGMTSTAIIQIMMVQEEKANFTSIGFPHYMMTVIGIWKILGVVVILIPRFPLLKEWAYAGFFFAMSGAVISHVLSGHDSATLFGPALLLVLTMVSWYIRPAERKVSAISFKTT